MLKIYTSFLLGSFRIHIETDLQFQRDFSACFDTLPMRLPSFQRVSYEMELEHPCLQGCSRATSADYNHTDLVVEITTAPILYGSPFDAGRRSSRRPFQPSSIVPIGIRIEAPLSDTP